MRPTHLRLFSWMTVGILTGVISLYAADAVPPEPLRGNIENVEDMRSMLSSTGCRVSVVVFGDDLDDVAAIADTQVTKAVDDLGHSLVPADTTERNTLIMPGLRIGVGHGPLLATILLRNPSRRATTVKEIEATLRLYKPSAENGGIIRLPSPSEHPDTILKSDALEKLGIAIEYVSTDRGTNLTQSGPHPTPAAEQARLESVAAEVARRREMRQQQAVDAMAAAAAATQSLPPSRANYESSGPIAVVPATALPARYQSTFRVTDPNHRLVALEWNDDTGARVRGSFGWFAGQNRMLVALEPPQANWTLVAYVRTDSSLESRTLRLENVALP